MMICPGCEKGRDECECLGIADRPTAHPWCSRCQMFGCKCGETEESRKIAMNDRQKRELEKQEAMRKTKRDHEEKEKIQTRHRRQSALNRMAGNIASGRVPDFKRWPEALSNDCIQRVSSDSVTIASTIMGLTRRAMTVSEYSDANEKPIPGQLDGDDAFCAGMDEMRQAVIELIKARRSRTNPGETLTALQELTTQVRNVVP